MALNEYDAFLQDNPASLPDTKANPYDAGVQAQTAADQTALRGSMFVAGQTTPDRAAQVIKLSERTKIPVPVVERNFDTLSKKFDLTDDEYGSIIKNNPTLTTWLGDPTNAAVSRDDLTTLQRIENTVRSFTRGWTRASSGGDLADLLFKEVEQGSLSPPEAAQRDRLKAQQKQLSAEDQANGLPEYIAGTTGYTARQMGSSVYAGVQGVAYGGVAGAVAGSVLPGVGTVAGGTAGMISGGLTAGAVYSYRMETGFAFDDLRSMKDINGNTIDPMIARQAARGVGMVNAVIETGSGALLATLVPGFSKLTAGLGGDAAKAAVRQAVKQALAVPTRRAMILGALGKMGSAASIEGLEEFVQALVGAGGREIAQSASGQAFAPDSVMADLADASRQALDATVGTFFTFAPVGGAHIYVQARQAAKAQQQAAFFGALGGDVQGSKTFERLPQKMQDFIGQATKDGPIETVYVDPSAFVTYWQNQGVDPRAAAEEIIGDATQYDHALLSGEQIEIPMSRYATRIAPTEANAYFANEMRLSPEAMNAREGSEFEAKMAEEQKAALAAVPKEEQDVIKEQIKQQLIDAGTEPATAETQATAFATTAAVMAARSGQTPEQVLAPYGLKISRPSLQEQAAPEGQTAMEQRGRTPSLIIQHNLTGENLLHALRMGGLVAPSLAITKATDPMSNFGEITLIGRKEMADPRGYARPKVFGADVYSPRYPDVHYKFDAKGEKVLRDQIERFSSVTGERYFDLDELQKKGARYLQSTGTMMAAFLTEKGIAFERYSDPDKWQADAGTRREMGKLLDQNNLNREFETFTEKFLASMNPSERIFKGFNYNGNRTYAAHTIDNVIRMLKKDLRGGESNTNIYGVGQLRAKFTPQFRSVTAIQAAEGRIVSDAEFERVKEEIDQEFFAIVEAVTPYYQHKVEPFRFNDTVLALIEDGATMGLDRAAKEYSFEALPDDVKDQIRQFYTHLRNLPTEYFEAKILRGVGVSEFAAAVVPNDAPQSVIDALNNHGVQIEQYEKNNVEDRKRAVAALTGKFGEKVLFQNDTIDGLTGEVMENPTYYSDLVRQIESAKIDKVPADQWKKYISGLMSKGVKKEEIAVSGVLDWLDIRAAAKESYKLLAADGAVVAQGDAVAEERWARMIMAGTLPVGERTEKVEAQSPKVSRQEVLDYLEANHVKVEEKILGEPRKPPPSTAVATATDQLPAGYEVRHITDVPLNHHVGRMTHYVMGPEGGSHGAGMTVADAIANYLTSQADDADRQNGLPDGYTIDQDGNDFAVTLPDGSNLDLYDSRQEAIDAAIEHFDENGITDEQVEEKARELWEEQLPEEARSYAQDSDWVNERFEVTFRPPSFKIVEIPADAFRAEPRYGVRKLEFDDLPPQMEDDDGTAARETKGMPDDLDEFNEMWPEGPTESWATTEEFASEAEARKWAEEQEDDNGFAWHDGDPIWTTRDPENNDDVEDYESWDDVSSAATSRQESRYESEVDSYIENADFGDASEHYEREAREILEDERGQGHTTHSNRRRRAAALPDPTAPLYPLRYATQYQSIGGRDYREIPMMVPGIEPYNKGDSVHYGPEGEGRTVVWIRVKVQDDKAGVPTLWIEEDQSQRGQHGLKQGFKGDFDQKKYNKLAAELDASMLEGAAAAEAGKLPEGFNSIFDRTEPAARQWAVVPSSQIHGKPLFGSFATEQEAVADAIQKIYEGRHVAISEQMRQLQSDVGKVPPAPFVTETQSWAALGFARALRYAVDHKLTQIAWTTGAENALRYGTQSEIDSLKWTKVEGGIQISAVKDGKTVLDKYLEEKDIAAHIGPRVQDKIKNDSSQAGEIAASELDSINGLGMLGFYGDSKGLNQMGKPAIMMIAANKVLKRVGEGQVEPIDIEVKEKGQTFDGAPGVKITPAMAQKIRGGLPMFYQKGEGLKRGRIRIGGDRKMFIDLLEGANLSTFIHETGHFWLEVFGDLVDGFKQRDPTTLSDQQKRMVADYDTLLKWLGVENRLGIAEEHHEKFARAIERFYMQGKAPSAELRTVFARVRSWMISIYKSTAALRVTTSPEVDAVFGRMMASDEQIAAAEREAEIVPMFEDEEKFIAAGFDKAFVDAYRGQVQKAKDEAETQLQAKLMRTLTREREAWFKGERIKVRNEIAAEVNARREQIALSVMVRGQMPDGSAPEIEGKIRLNRGEVDILAGKDAWKRLPRGMTIESGVPLQVAAELFGYASGDELVRAMNSVRPANQVIEEETDAKMKELHGDLLVDSGIVDAAREAVQNGERVKVIEAELRVLSHLRAMAAPAVAEQARQAADAAKQAGRQQEYQKRWQDAETALLVAMQKGEDQAIIDRMRAELVALKAGIRTTGAQIRASLPPAAAIRQAAQGRISATRVRDLKPMQFLNAARRASQEAKLAAAEQDYQGAVTSKQRELLNIELYRAAMAAQEEVGKTAEYMRKFEDNKVRGRIAKAGQDYLDQIDGFLDRYDFAHVSLKAMDRRKNLAAWVAQKEADGEPVNLPDDVLVETRINYKDMTVEELRGVSDSVRHIEHLAKLKNRLLTSKRTKDLQAAIDELDESLRLNVRKAKGIPIETRLPQDEAARFIDTWFAMHRKLSEFAREMDGWKDGGLAWEYFVRPVNEAGDAETVMNHEAATKIKELFGLYEGKEIAALYVKQDIPALGASLTRMAQLMVALNWGNLDSRQKLMDGRGWNEQQVEAILNRLDERDWKFVQGVLDFINSYWPAIEAKEKRVNGIAPAKVVAAPITTQFGEMPGGYFPMSYDDRASPKAYGNRVKEISEQMMKGAFTRASTRRGHTKERVAGVRMPVRLDFGVITEHVSQVIHDLTHHEMLIDINRIFGNKQIASTIVTMHGDVIYKQMQEAIRDVAAGSVPAIGAFEKSLNHVRTGMTVAALGWNVMTSLLQPFGLSQSWVRVGGKWIAKGVGRWIGDAAHMENTAAWIKAKSPAMNDRMNTQLREINEIRNDIGLNTGKITGWIDEALRKTTFDVVHRQAIVDSFFWLIGKGQQIADIPTWLGAYEKAMADTANDEARAIAMADQAVLDSQGGGMIKDLAGIQRGGPLLKVWTAFYSYFNVTWNRNVEAVGRTHFKNPVEVARLGVDLLLLNTLPATLGWLTAQMLTGKDDDWDEWMKKLLQANVSYVLGMMVGLREFGSVVQGYYGYAGPAGIRFFSDMANLLKQAGQMELDAAFWKFLNNAAGTLLHYPAGQVRRTTEGFNAIMEGETKNPLALLVGPRKE